MLPRNQRQEAFSRAYVRAIAAGAGLAVIEPVCDYGIDLLLRALTIRDGRCRDVGPQLDLQLKSTTRAGIGATHLTYDLNVVNYDDLRLSSQLATRILVVLILPDDETLWLSQSPEELILRHCAYWMSLEGHPVSTSRSTVRMAIPLTNIFSVTAVQELIQRLRERSPR